MLKWLKRDRHEHAIGDGTSFSISLLLPGQRKLTGKLVDANTSGATISFPAGECPDLEKGERIRLSLMPAKSQKAVALDALVKGSTASRNRILYEFGFIDLSHLLKDMDPVLLDLFNRRGRQRVGPGPLNPIDVVLDWNGLSTRGSMFDISLTGIAVRVQATVARKLENVNQISITFVLPEQKDRCRLVGRSVRLKPLQQGVLIGIEFDRKKTERVRQQEQWISNYVMRRAV